MKHFKETMAKNKGFLAAVGAVTTLAVSGTGAFAAGEDMSTISTSITTQFGSIVTAALVVLGAVAGSGLILFGGIYAWKYGKKVFSVIAK